MEERKIVQGKPEPAKPTPSAKARRPYSAPSAAFVKLEPEESLLACSKLSLFGGCGLPFVLS